MGCQGLKNNNTNNETTKLPSSFVSNINDCTDRLSSDFGFIISKSELKRTFQTHSFCLYSLLVTEKPLNLYDKVLALTLLEKHIELYIYPNYSGNKMPQRSAI